MEEGEVIFQVVEIRKIVVNLNECLQTQVFKLKDKSILLERTDPEILTIIRRE